MFTVLVVGKDRETSMDRFVLLTLAGHTSPTSLLARGHGEWRHLGSEVLYAQPATTKYYDGGRSSVVIKESQNSNLSVCAR